MMKHLPCFLITVCLLLAACPPPQGSGERVELESDGWVVVGDLQVPASDEPVPAVLMLHMMPTVRSSYIRLADLFAERGIASLRIDLRGHGESTNLGGHNREVNARAWRDVVAALDFLRSREGVIDPARLGVLGASYSGEHAARAGREGCDIAAYAILSSGGFSEESIAFVGSGEAPWLFVAARDDGERTPALMERAAAAAGERGELIMYDAGGHGTYLFSVYSDLEERIADWFADRLSGPVDW